jgi:hypothetical protein
LSTEERNDLVNKKTQKIIDNNGNVTRKSIDIRKKLNYNYLYLTDQTHLVGKYGIPAVYCNTSEYPDYLALYNQTGYYHKTISTAVCFYQYDMAFDSIDGIYNAIYYGNKKLLAFYKERFKDVKFFISPDYSMFGDIDMIGNLNQLKKARIVSLWLAKEIHAVVIPNLSYTSEDNFDIFFSGLEECSVVALSLKSHIRNPNERKLTISAIKYAVDHLPLKAVVVYSACGKDETVYSIFKYAIDKNIKIIIPNNSLRESNMRRCCL